MTKFNEATDSDAALERESLAWVNRLLAGPLTPADAEALTAWRGRSPAHEARFVEAVRFQRKVRRAVEQARVEPAAGRGAASSRPASGLNVGRRALMGGALAASVVGGGLVLTPAGGWPSLRSLMADYRTGVGERRSVAAGAGVAVELDALTEVDLRPSRGLQGIELISGKAEVAAQRPPGAPFSVAALGGQVLVANGRIDVRHLDGSVCVTCVQGQAEVRHPAGRRRLGAGRQVVYTARALGPDAAADLAVVTAWRQGLLIFRDAPLQQVVDELNRYRKGRVVLLDESLATRPVYGVFQLAQIGRAVEQIERLTGARATALPGEIVVLS